MLFCIITYSTYSVNEPGKYLMQLFLNNAISLNHKSAIKKQVVVSQ